VLLKEAEKETAKVAKTAEKARKDTERKAAKVAKAAEKFLKDAEKKTAKAAEKAFKAAQVIENRAAATRGRKAAIHGARGARGKKATLAHLFPSPDVQPSESFDTSSDLTTSPSQSLDDHASDCSSTESSDNAFGPVIPVIPAFAGASTQSRHLSIPPGNDLGCTRAGCKVQLTRRAQGME